MKTVGIVTTWFNRGAAFVSKNFLEVLKGEFNVIVYARGGEKYEREDPNWNLSNVYWGKNLHVGVPNLIYWPDFKRWLEEKQPDVLLFNEQQSWDVIIKVKNYAPDVLIGAYVDYYTRETVPYFNLYDFLVCNTKRHMSVFEKHPQSFYIPWGTDIDLYKPSQELQRNYVTFFHSCGMNPYRKGTDLLLSAFTKLGNKDARLVIHSQVPLPKSMRSIINSEDRNITIIEKTIPPPGLYYLGDIYVYPSRLDGIGLTIAEALASGLPVLTTDNGPMNEFIRPGITGYLVQVEKYYQRSDGYYWEACDCSVDELQNRMQAMLQQREKIVEMKRNAREYAIEYLNWKKNANQLVDIVNNLKKIPVEEELLNSVAKYEYSSYSRIIFRSIKSRFAKQKF